MNKTKWPTASVKVKSFFGFLLANRSVQEDNRLLEEILPAAIDGKIVVREKKLTLCSPAYVALGAVFRLVNGKQKVVDGRIVVLRMSQNDAAMNVEFGVQRVGVYGRRQALTRFSVTSRQRQPDGLVFEVDGFLLKYPQNFLRFTVVLVQHKRISYVVVAKSRLESKGNFTQSLH